MEILVVRHAQSLHNINATDELNSELTSDGFVQILTLADWLLNEFDLTNYSGLTSPYIRTLQTSLCLNQVCGLDFSIEPAVREYHSDKTHPQISDGSMFISSEQVKYPEFTWPEEDNLSTGRSYPNEELEELVDRVKSFHDSLLEDDGKYVVVSHGAPCRVLCDVALGNDLNYLFDRYDIKHVKEKKSNSIPNASASWIVDGEAQFMSKVVY